MTGLRMFATVTRGGTAMAESALCADHYSDPALVAYAAHVAIGADDVQWPLEWRDCTGNDALFCQECGRDSMGNLSRAWLNG